MILDRTVLNPSQNSNEKSKILPLVTPNYPSNTNITLIVQHQNDVLKTDATMAKIIEKQKRIVCSLPIKTRAWVLIAVIK